MATYDDTEMSLSEMDSDVSTPSASCTSTAGDARMNATRS